MASAESAARAERIREVLDSTFEERTGVPLSTVRKTRKPDIKGVETLEQGDETVILVDGRWICVLDQRWYVKSYSNDVRVRVERGVRVPVQVWDLDQIDAPLVAEGEVETLDLAAILELVNRK